LNTLSADKDPNELDCHQTHDSNKKLPETKSDINTERTHNPTDSNNDISDDEIVLAFVTRKKREIINFYNDVYATVEYNHVCPHA
jgi:hypothetical protein